MSDVNLKLNYTQNYLMSLISFPKFLLLLNWTGSLLLSHIKYIVEYNLFHVTGVEYCTSIIVVYQTLLQVQHYRVITGNFETVKPIPE